MACEFDQLITSPQEVQGRISFINSLKDVPLYLYGAGFYANEVEQFLKTVGVNVKGRVVDDCFLEDRCVEENLMGVATLRNQSEAYNLLLAFCGNPRLDVGRILTRNFPGMDEIHVVDCRFWQRFPVLDLEFFIRGRESFINIFESLEDELSKETFCEFINAKLLADPLPLERLCQDGQYFPADIPEFMPTAADVVVDGGAFTGDTLLEFVERSGGRGANEYYAFEPDAENLNHLSRTIEEGGLKSVSVVPCGLWDEETSLSFISQEGSRSGFEECGETMVQVTSLDQYQIAPTFIKLDIEGAELHALKGAAETIAKYRPRIAVALYHKMEDLYEVPIYLKELCPDYRFYLRLHSYFSEELVLYATI